MAQLNDLLVLGKTNFISEVKINDSLNIQGNLSVKGTIDQLSKYLPLSGGTMTGTDLGLYDKYGFIKTTTDSLQLQSRSDKTANNARCLSLVNTNNSSPDLADSLKLIETSNGSISSYNIYGEHNKPTAKEIGAYPSDSLSDGADITDFNNIGNGAWKIKSNASNAPTTYAHVVFHKDWDINFASQMAFCNNHSIWFRFKTGGAWGNWTSYFLPLSGGTMTGVLKMPSSMYEDARNGALDMSNSDIFNANSIYFADLVDNGAEGFHFYRSETTVDSLWAKNGVLYFTPNRTMGSTGTNYTILHSGNMNSYVLPLSGGTLTGQIKINRAGSSWIGVIDYPEVNYIYADHSSATNSVYHSMMALRYANHTFSIGGERASEQFGIYAYNNTRTENGQDAGFYVANNLNFYCSTKLYGAVWNDYAEYRIADSIEPGRVVLEHESGSMKLSTERLQPGAEIISDTFGFAIGETEECKTPIAATGRVLAYPNEDRYSYPLGAAVCSGPNGTVSLMTREEIKEYPERIIGTVSEIPEYEEWGTGKVKVNGRIWIRIK